MSRLAVPPAVRISPRQILNWGITMRCKLISSVRRGILLGAMGIAVAACSNSPIVMEDTISYNRAVALSTDKMLLLNIVRASHREPTYYTRLEGNTESTGLSTTNSLALPINRSRTLSPGGTPAVSSTLANIAASIGFGAADTSVLTLQTLDDQKYQNGMMNPLDESTVQIYWNEGLQKDLLMLLFVSSINIDRAPLQALKDQVKANCEGNSEAEELKKFCIAYNFSPVDITGAVCAPGNRDDDTINFVNDPAIGNNKVECFRKLILGLIGSGLDMDDLKSTKAIEKHVSAKSLELSEFRAEILKEGLDIVPEKSGAGLEPQLYALCKSKSGGAVFVFDQSDFDAIARNLPARLATKIEKERNNPCDTDNTAAVPGISALGIDITYRSFEGINYYLGEIVRAGSRGPRHLIVPVVSRDGTEPDEDLFVALAGESPDEASVEVRDDFGRGYYIPGKCGNYANPAKDDSSCAEENPGNESLQVLTMLDQLWGLNKEATTGPATPAVVVGGATATP